MQTISNRELLNVDSLKNTADSLHTETIQINGRPCL